MTNKLFQNLIGLFLLFLLAACKEEYYPKVKSSEQSALVVEGVLNSGSGPTTIKLSRTFKLDDTARLKPETAAQVRVEEKDGAAFPLYDVSGTGNYSADQLALDPATQYRLYIKTTNGNEYASDFVSVLKNPPIDSVNWRLQPDGVHIYVNTHNQENDTRYYRWEYDETWEIHSNYYATWKLVDGAPQKILPPEQYYTCWRYNQFPGILLGSTTQLASDVIFEKPLIFIPINTDRLSVRYSVLVRQYALDKAGYDFFQLIKKNTESVGSIFDAQPVEITGNIHAISNTSEPVIGDITAAPVQENRIYITADQVPDWDFRLQCKTVNVPNKRDSFPIYYGGDLLPYGANEPFITTYYSAPPECVDCRVRGGVTEKPSFW